MQSLLCFTSFCSSNKHSSRAVVLIVIVVVLCILCLGTQIRSIRYYDTLFFQVYYETDIVQNSTSKEYTTRDTTTLYSNDPPRILIGIFTTDLSNNDNGLEYRNRHRALFQKWNDSRICSLYDYKQQQITSITGNNNRDNSNNNTGILSSTTCEFIYTFVIGANPNGPTELVQIDYSSTTDKNKNRFVSWRNRIISFDTTNITWTVPRPMINARNTDINTHTDITLLNIRENMNEGKSESWIAYYTEHLMKQYHFDYVAKWDADSILLLPEYFDFVYSNLPKAPYNHMMYIGAIYDGKRHGLYDKNHHSIMVYVRGQVYILANDLAQYITNEAIKNHCIYCKGVEDYDIASIAYHGSPHPIQFVMIGNHQQFWVHPIKTNKDWQKVWKREQKRIETYHVEQQL